MKKTNHQKEFDAVKMMREIRDKISRDTQGMTFEQLKDYIKTNLSGSSSKLVGQK